MFEDWINNKVKNVLLVEPNFPIPKKSRNHSNFLPIGLLKIASYLRYKNINVELIRFDSNEKNSNRINAGFNMCNKSFHLLEYIRERNCEIL